MSNQNNVPTAPGLHYRNNQHWNEPDVVRVYQGARLIYFVTGSVKSWPVEDDGLWAGPVPMPGEFVLIENTEDICGLCGEPGADKVPHPLRWPGERAPDTELVHAECEHEECGRAHAALSQEQRESVLRNI